MMMWFLNLVAVYWSNKHEIRRNSCAYALDNVLKNSSSVPRESLPAAQRPLSPCGLLSSCKYVKAYIVFVRKL